MLPIILQHWLSPGDHLSQVSVITDISTIYQQILLAWGSPKVKQLTIGMNLLLYILRQLFNYSLHEPGIYHPQIHFFITSKGLSLIWRIYCEVFTAENIQSIAKMLQSIAKSMATCCIKINRRTQNVCFPTISMHYATNSC